MGRKKIGIAQVRFDFAITPRSEQDKYVVEALERMKDTNELSTFLRGLVYSALPLPGHKATEAPAKPVEPSRPAERPIAAQPSAHTWGGKPSPKPS